MSVAIFLKRGFQSERLSQTAAKEGRWELLLGSAACENRKVFLITGSLCRIAGIGLLAVLEDS